MQMTLYTGNVDVGLGCGGAIHAEVESFNDEVSVQGGSRDHVSRPAHVILDFRQRRIRRSHVEISTAAHNLQSG